MPTKNWRDVRREPSAKAKAELETQLAHNHPPIYVQVIADLDINPDDPVPFWPIEQQGEDGCSATSE